jgi:subtilisin family serine protease
VEECSCNQSQCNYIAVEYWDADYEAIRTAVANGVVVVQAAGNGSANFDDPVYGGRFDRSVRDSGAIIVSGSGSTLREPQCWSNYGERVDLHAWGTSVVTTGYGDLHTGLDASDPNSWYTRGFSGSSSASPIAAGAVASMLGVFYEETGRWLNPAQVRELLVQNGTAQTAGLTRDIGVLPDLRRAIGTMINNKAALIAELDGEQDEVCVSYEATLAEHLAAGRAYTQSSGFWWAVTKTYYAVGSNEKLGTLASTVVSLVETEQGYQVGVCSDQDDDDDNGEEGVCITAANLTHISEGRAISCGNSFMPSACAVGSNDNLGYASQWFNQTSSVQETSANYWVKVASCP